MRFESYKKYLPHISFPPTVAPYVQQIFNSKTPKETYARLELKIPPKYRRMIEQVIEILERKRFIEKLKRVRDKYCQKRL